MIEYFIILILSIICHELGHLLMALFWKIKVYACSFGFGKILLHKKWKNIDWRISAIPLGGYCEIEEDLKKSNNLYSISYWKQLTIILAGVFVNFLIAFICYWIQFKSIRMGLIIDWNLLRGFWLHDHTELYNILLNINIKHINFFLLQCGFINITLAIGNCLPIPALDGGYIWLLLLRKKITEKMYKLIILLGFIFVILLQIYFVWHIYFNK